MDEPSGYAKWQCFKVGVKLGHMGRRKGIEILIPVVARDIMDARRRALKRGSVKKRFRYIWLTEPCSQAEYQALRVEYRRFQTRWQQGA